MNLVWIFVLGAKGSAWAWRNTDWKGVEHFQRVQRNWAVAGAIAWIGVLGITAASLYGISSAIRHSDVYRGAVERLQASAAAAEALGAPMTTGFPMGSVSVSGPGGEAQLSIPVQGARAKGTLYLQATRAMGRWQYDLMELEVEGRDARIDLNSGRAVPAPTRDAVQASLRPPGEPRARPRIA